MRKRLRTKIQKARQIKEEPIDEVYLEHHKKKLRLLRARRRIRRLQILIFRLRRFSKVILIVCLAFSL